MSRHRPDRRAPRPRPEPQPGPGEPARHTTQPAVEHALANLRTTRTLRLVADLLSRLRTLASSVTSAASPVSRGVRRLQGRDRRLQIAETVQLGEKRFVAILRVDGEQFLIGGSATGVSLLASLAPTPATQATPHAAPATQATPHAAPAIQPAEYVRVVAPAAEQITLAAPHSPASFTAVLAAQQSHGGLA